jgi:ribosomal protein S12 methylthiotransferase
LIEGPSPDSDLLWQGRMSTQAPDIDGVCYISDPGTGPLEKGQLRRMRITEAHDYDLVGNLIDEGRALPKPAQPLFPILAAHQTPNNLPHR